MKRRKIDKLLLFIIFFFLFSINVYASSASIGLTGDSSVYNGETINIGINLNNTDSILVSFGGTINYDTKVLKLQSCSSSSRLTYSNNGLKVAFVDYTTTGIKSGKIGICTFKAIALGSTKVSISGASATDNSANLNVSVASKTINVVNPQSDNSNLKSLSVTNTNISYQNGKTTYEGTVDANVENVSISAIAEDNNANVSGTGNKSLKYGLNTFTISVKAENGSVKKYTVKITRKDNRSSNNYLSSMKVSNGTLKQPFSKTETSYTMEVPYSVSSLNITATPEDSKAKVSISNNSLKAESVTAVKVTVTAENGSTKTYTINVKRGKDPNKKLSTNNYLKSLTVSVGILSPEFSKEKTSYIVYLPYEVTSIEINAEVDDTDYGNLRKEGNTNLIVGNNIIKYHVTAEDESVRTYTITVVRNNSLDGANDSTNTYLRSIVLNNGKLKTTFDKKVYYYEYDKTGKNAKIKEAIPEADSSKVSQYAFGDAFVIMVESQSGDRSFYVLVPKESNMLFFIIIGILGLLVVILLIIVLKKKKNKKQKKQ